MLRGILLLILQPFRLLVFLYYRIRAIHRPQVLEIGIRADYSEAPLSHGIWTFFKPEKDRFYLLALELQSVASACAAGLIKLERVAITFESHSLGWAQAWELRQLIGKIRAAGVSTEAYLISDDKISLFIASACDRVWSPESATFDLSPFTSESVFMSSFLNRIGIRPQFLSVGEFKSAAEIFTRNAMSKAARQQTEDLIHDLEHTFFAALTERDSSLAKGKKPGLVSAPEAVKRGLISDILSVSEFMALAKGKNRALRDLHDVTQLIHRKRFRLFTFKRPHRIALIAAEGNIIESPQPRPRTINWHDYSHIAAELTEGKFNAALIRVNSPGGSALVSQLLWREWMLAANRIAQSTVVAKETGGNHEKPKEAKPLPVYVSQGNVAASGGYYLSAAGSRIFASPMTITGSIGVVGGKFNVAPVMEKWGMHIDRAPKKNPAPVFSAFADFGPEQKKMLTANMEEIYEQFIRDVAAGRGKKPAEIKPLASGRVYSGARAEKLGLTDQNGGLTDALEALRKDLGLAAMAPLEIVILPAVRESLFSRSMLPFGLSRLAALADFARPGLYTLDPRYLTI